MDKSPWLDVYSGQTVDELLALEGKYRTDSIICVGFLQAISQRETWTAEERVIAVVNGLEDGVNMDGYVSYFANRSEDVPYLVDALLRIGRKDVADITERALSVIRVKSPWLQEDVEAAIAAMNEERAEYLADFDELYLGVAGDMSKDVLEFLKQNRGTILSGASE